MSVQWTVSGRCDTVGRARVSGTQALQTFFRQMSTGRALVSRLVTTAHGTDIWRAPDASVPIPATRRPGAGTAPDTGRGVSI